MGKELVRLDQIIINRDPEFADETDDLTELAQHIADHGLQVRPLIDHSGVLIDGLRRLRIMQDQGAVGSTLIPVVRSPDWNFTIQHLEMAHQTHPELIQRPSGLRLYELYLSTATQRATRRMQRHGHRNKTHAPEPPTRDTLCAILGTHPTNLHYTQKLYRLYTDPDTSKEGKKVLRELLRGVANHNIGPRTANNHWEAWVAGKGNIKPRNALVQVTQEVSRYTTKEQVDLLTAAFDELDRVTRTVVDMGPISPELPLDVSKKLHKQLSNTRTELFRVAAALRQRNENEPQD